MPLTIYGFPEGVEYVLVEYGLESYEGRFPIEAEVDTHLVVDLEQGGSFIFPVDLLFIYGVSCYGEPEGGTLVHGFFDLMQSLQYDLTLHGIIDLVAYTLIQFSECHLIFQ